MRYRNVFVIASATILLMGGTASGVNIAWVSFHGGSEDGSVPSANASNLGFTTAPDKGYTDLLIGAGHTINRVTVPDAALNTAIPPDTLAELNAADLVIVGRSLNSGSFQQADEVLSWNTEITKPMIITSGFLTRGGTNAGNIRLGYTQGDTVTDITAAQGLRAVLPLHPVFQGVTLNANNETTSPVLQMVTVDMDPDGAAGPMGIQPIAQRGTSINNNLLVAGASLIATTSPTATGGPTNAPVIAEFPADTLSFQGQAFSSRRMTFITGTRETGITPAPPNSGDSAGILDLTPIGQQLFLNTVTYITTPLIPGDTDGDLIGGEFPDDFNPIRDNFRKSPRSRAQGDLDSNGVVDFNDFRQWKTAHGASGASLDGVDFGFLAGVPEPGSALLLVIASGALIWHRHGKRLKGH